MSNALIVTILAILGAAASLAAFAVPYLKRREKKDRYRAIIEKRRKALFEATRDGTMARAPEKIISAADSMATFYRVQQLAGQMGEKVRDKMLQAGIRDPAAPLKFMIARVVLPFVLCLFLFIIFTASDKEIEAGTKFMIIVGAGAFAFKLPDILVKNIIMKRQQEINLAFPDSLDLMLICVQGGIGLEQTIDRVAHEVSEHSEVLAEELGILSAEMAMLNDRRKALQDFARRVGSGAGKTFATALIQAEQYGTSVSQALRVMADELRDMRMAAAEEKAASLPPKLTVPMILFFLPALFIIILAPAGLQAAAAGLGAN